MLKDISFNGVKSLYPFFLSKNPTTFCFSIVTASIGILNVLVTLTISTALFFAIIKYPPQNIVIS